MSGASDSVMLTILEDGLVEGDETFTVDLTAGTKTVIGGGLGLPWTTTIEDNDTAAFIFDTDSTVGEGTSPHVVGVTLDITAIGGPAGLGLPVGINVTDTIGLATDNGTDYSFTDTNIVFLAGLYPVDPTSSVSAIIFEDGLVEGDEDFRYGAAQDSLTAASLITTQITTTDFHNATIDDNDTFSISFEPDTTAPEGTSSHNVDLTLTILAIGGAPGLQYPVSVDVTDTPGSATGGGIDYSFTNATVTFAPFTGASSTEMVDSTIVEDLIVEGDEDFDLDGALDAATMAAPGSHQFMGPIMSHTVTIVDNDTATIEFVTSASAVHEVTGPSPHIVDVKMVITSVGPGGGVGIGSLAADVSVDVDDLDTGTAASPADYSYMDPTTLTFAATALAVSGMQTQSVSLGIVNDGPGEGSETVNLMLNNLNPADGYDGQVTIPSATDDHTVTIHDREVKIQAIDKFPVENLADNQDTNPSNNSQFRVTISTASAYDTKVTFTLGGTATLGPGGLYDYTLGPQVSGAGPYTVIIPAGQTQRVFDIDIFDDLLLDPNETIIATLVSAESVDPGTMTPAAVPDLLVLAAMNTDTMTIVDNEMGSTVSVTKSLPVGGNAKEGNTFGPAAVDGQFKIQLDQALDNLVDVTLAIGGDAMYGVDYILTGADIVSQTSTTVVVRIPANQTMAFVNVEPIEEDALVELDEAVTLTPVSTTDPADVTVGAGASLIIEDEETGEVDAGTNQTGSESGGFITVTFNQTEVGNTTPRLASTDTILDISKVENADLIYGVDYVAYSNYDPGPIAETSNNTIGGAQNLDGEHWNLAPNPEVMGGVTTDRM